MGKGKSVFLQGSSKQEIEAMLDRSSITLQQVDRSRALKCPHVKEKLNKDGDIVEYESTADKYMEKTIPINVDGDIVKIKGTSFKCSICGKVFFVPMKAMSSATGAVGRFKAFAETYRDISRLHRDMSYAEASIRGTYEGDMSLDVPAKIRGRLSKDYLDALSGEIPTVEDGMPRGDKSMQLNRGLFLAHLEAKVELWEAIVDYLNGREVDINDDIDLAAFGTGVSRDSYIPERDLIPNNNIDTTRRTRHMDLVNPDRGGRRNSGRNNRNDRGSKKNKKEDNSGKTRKVKGLEKED